MPFCTTCGSEVQGRFCVKCGAPAAAPAAPPAPPALVPAVASSPAPMARAATPPVKKKTSPLVWILVAVVAMFVLVGVAVVGAGVFFVHKAKQAGLDPELMQRNPGLAMTKLLAAVNPDIEVLRVDEGRGLITVRDKKTGKTTTVDFEDVKQGRIRFTDENGQAMTLESKGDGNAGSLSLKSSDGSVEMGAGADVKVPSWIPVYPGAQVEGKYHQQNPDGEAGAFGYSTKTASKDMVEFYRRGLEAAGLKVAAQVGDSTGGVISAEDGTKSRTVTAIVSPEGDGTSVVITYAIKK